jgi:hypothetical protein
VAAKLAQNQGQSRFSLVGRRAVQPSEVGDPAASSYLGLTSPYYIDNGKIVTEMVGTPIEVTAYKVGDKYYGVRSNEFGYANYEIIPAEKEVNPLDPGKVLR